MRSTLSDVNEEKKNTALTVRFAGRRDRLVDGRARGERGAASLAAGLQHKAEGGSRSARSFAPVHLRKLTPFLRPAEVRVVPSRTWSSAAVPGGETGAVDGQPSLLGLSLRLCDPQHALEQVRTLQQQVNVETQADEAESYRSGTSSRSCKARPLKAQVRLNPPLLCALYLTSPHSGLVPYGDWIVGYAGGVLRGEGDFYDIVESVRTTRCLVVHSGLTLFVVIQHVDKPLRLFVYNSDYDVLREVILVPNRSWGGDGLLGCGVGYGLLHRIPKPQDRARQAPPPAPVGQQFQPTYAPPPPSTSSPASAQNRQADRLTSFSNQSGVVSAQNPLYAPPPPRSSGATATPPRNNARPPPPPVMSAPPPPRRTAALTYDEEDDDEDEQRQNSYGGDGYGSSSRNYDSSYGSEHPSFSRYGDDGGYGAYDASDGVEVVPVEVITEEGDEDEHEASFVSSASGRGGPTGYGATPPRQQQQYGGARSGYGAARIAAEEAE